MTRNLATDTPCHKKEVTDVTLKAHSHPRRVLRASTGIVPT